MTVREPVGTLAEEAARLLTVMHSWAGDSRAGDVRADDSSAGTAPATGTAEGAGPDRASRLGGDSDDPTEGRASEHDTAECRWCPHCQLMRRAKATSPDVRQHLSQAAVSLALAVKGMLDDVETTPRRETPLEKIDLTED